MTETVKVEGLRELRLALDALPSATARGVMIRVLKKRAQPIADRAASLAPVDSGDLRKSIVVSTRLTRRQFALHQKPGSDEVEVFVGPSDLPQAHLQEFGTEHNAPQPFMRPAWDQEKSGILDGLAADIWAEILRAIGGRSGEEPGE